MASKLSSFPHSFSEKTEKEKLISSKTDFSSNGLQENDQEQEKATYKSCGYSWFSVISDKVEAFFKNLKYVGFKAWEMGRSDPRKIVFSAKMGLALVLISLLIFFKEPIEELSQFSVWAILTVVVVFEFSIGMCKFIWLFVFLCVFLYFECACALDFWPFLAFFFFNYLVLSFVDICMIGMPYVSF